MISAADCMTLPCHNSSFENGAFFGPPCGGFRVLEVHFRASGFMACYDCLYQVITCIIDVSGRWGVA